MLLYLFFASVGASTGGAAQLLRSATRTSPIQALFRLY